MSSNGWLMEYYKIAEERIGQYDSHTFRCKQWVSALVTAVIIASYYKPDVSHLLFWGGLFLLVLLFLVEMTLRTVIRRLILYCKDLEDQEAIRTNAPETSEICEKQKNRLKVTDLRLAHAISPGFWRAWWEYLKTIIYGLSRPGVIVPYLVAGFILWVGTLLAVKYGVR